MSVWPPNHVSSAIFLNFVCLFSLYCLIQRCFPYTFIHRHWSIWSETWLTLRAGGTSVRCHITYTFPLICLCSDTLSSVSTAVHKASRNLYNRSSAIIGMYLWVIYQWATYTKPHHIIGHSSTSDWSEPDRPSRSYFTSQVNQSVKNDMYTIGN